MWTPNYWPWILDLESWRIKACLIAILNLWSWISWSFFVVGGTLYVDLLNLDPELLNLNLWSWTLATHFMLGDLESLILNFMEDIWWEDWSTLIAALLLCFSLLLLVFSAVCWPLLLLLLSLFLHDWITKFVVLVCFSFCTFSGWAKLSAFRGSSTTTGKRYLYWIVIGRFALSSILCPRSPFYGIGWVLFFQIVQFASPQ